MINLKKYQLIVFFLLIALPEFSRESLAYVNGRG